MSKQKIFSIMRNKFLILFILMLSSFYLTACGAPSAPATTGTGSSTGTGTTGATFTVGGTVSGLNLGQSITLQNNSGDDLTVSANGLFTFAAPVNDKSTYNIGVSTQPAGETCSVLNNSGTINSSSIVNVAVNCIDTTSGIPYSISGTVSGLTEIDNSVVLKIGDGSGNNLGSTTIKYNSTDATASPVSPVPFTFLTSFANGSQYAVTVGSASNGKTCSVLNSSGTIDSSNIVSVAVNCITTTAGKPYSVSGTVSGLTQLSDSVVLKIGDGAGNNLGSTTIKYNSPDATASPVSPVPFTFPISFADSSQYAVTVSNASNGKTCTISNASGTIDKSNVVSVYVVCQ